jgi:hypothetical protein
MSSWVWGGGQTAMTAVALAVAIGSFSGIPTRADEGVVQGVFHQGKWCPGEGTLGYGGYGLYPGLPGFGLAYHPGYGYGGKALGVGVFGGYPFYGGPGYPHEPPRLNRFGPAMPYEYFGGPGYPIFGWSHFYQGIGGLVVDKPVVGIGEPGDFGYVGENGEFGAGNDFGQFTGTLPSASVMDRSRRPADTSELSTNRRSGNLGAAGVTAQTRKPWPGKRIRTERLKSLHSASTSSSR